MRMLGLSFWMLAPALALWTAVSAPRVPTGPSSERRAQIEADWLAQDAIRLAQRKPVAAAEDAAGAADGVKDGKWGFHTDNEPQPWWQVDLGAVQPLSRVLVYNRCDTAERTSHLLVLLSDDGATWREAYRHSGAPFYGATDGKPLVVTMSGAAARYVRLQLPAPGYLHLDEVEVYGVADPSRNLALGRPCNQSSVSQWSVRHALPDEPPSYPAEGVIARGRRLLADLRAAGVDAGEAAREMADAAARARALGAGAPPSARREVYFQARRAVRRLALSSPLLGFDRLLFVKRVPGTYSHMSDQNYGWWSRPGGGVYVLEGLRADAPRVRCLTPSLPPGSCLSPDVSYDGGKILFAWCRYYPGVAQLGDKETKSNLPEDAFYHLYEMNADGSGLHRLTRGRYDDFDARYLPDGGIVFLSTRRGQSVQCTQAETMRTTREDLPDSYVRCGGGPSRPVAVYTLHRMEADRSTIRALSPFENFEWTPSVAADGRILYARWDYVDRDNMPYMSLWSTNPDGTNPQIVYGNFTRNPHAIFEARTVPGSRKILFTASAHHSITGGSLVMLDPARGLDGPEPITRLTPEVCFPEAEGWPSSYYANPYPLSDRSYLAAWSPVRLNSEGGPNPPNALGLYLCDVYGNQELLYRDPDISSMHPVPLTARPIPPVMASGVAPSGPQDGRLLVLDVYKGLRGVPRGAVKRLRVVGMPAKTQPTMHSPAVGITRDDPGKCVLGTVPVEPDGSAYFRAPAGVPLFLQALDGEGMAIQTMRSLTYLQPRQTLSCVGCHEPRNTTPLNARAAAARRAPSRIAPGPDGSWPLRFDRLVQPVLDRQCVQCHSPGTAGASLDLTPARAYEALISYGTPSLRDHVMARYRAGRSPVEGGAARTSRLLTVLSAPGGHHGVRLGPGDRDRLLTWIDTYAQYLGSYSDSEEAALLRLRRDSADLLEADR